MRLLDLERVSDFRVEQWLEESLNLTDYQKQKLREDEIVRFAPIKFYQRTKRIDNFFIRLSIIFFPIVWFLLFLGLPFNYILTGKWGYKNLKWFSKWTNACGL